MKFLCLAYGDARDWEALSAAEQSELLAADDILRGGGDLVAAIEAPTTLGA